MQNDRVTIYVGDSADLDLPVNSVDAIVCDPPSGIAFMGKSWDKDHGGLDGWIAWLARTIAPAFAALKPGGHGLFWALPRTSHWTAMALELAGFEVRDRVTHLFGTGFPKSLNVSKAIDAHLGALDSLDDPITAEAAAWDGWGTALKPAAEDWWLVRKPLGSTVAACVLAHGTGALNIDASRIGSAGGGTNCSNRDEAGKCIGHANAGQSTSGETFHGPDTSGGRWPSHVVFSHSDECEVVGQAQDTIEKNDQPKEDLQSAGWGTRRMTTTTTTTTVDVYRCAPGCPVALLDAQSGTSKSTDRPRNNGAFKSVAKGAETARVSLGHADAGGASRFFYCAKPSKAETEAGLDDLPGKRKNTHPTKKSVALMRYLIRLITPPGGVVLDPFAGSGTTGIAALAEGMRFIGCEQGGDGEEYVPILLGRIGHALQRHG